MPYPQDLVGKYIAYTFDPGGNYRTGTPLVNGVLPGQTTLSTVKVYRANAPAPPARGQRRTPPLVPWRFTFLKYLAGAVTTSPLAGGVLTGPMSGCYLFRHTVAGVQHIAHVGTADKQDSQESIQAKANWRNFATLPNIANVWGCAPKDYIPNAEIVNAIVGRLAGPRSIPMVAGYFNGAMAYAMLLAPVPANMIPPHVPRGTNLLHVAGVKRMTLQPWATIGAMRTFNM